MIGRLLGHTQVETTARYAHLAEDSLRDSAVRISDSIADDLLENYLAGRMAEAKTAQLSAEMGRHRHTGRRLPTSATTRVVARKLRGAAKVVRG